MFAALFFERDPLLFRDLPAGVMSWLQDAGGFAMAGLVLCLRALYSCSALLLVFLFVSLFIDTKPSYQVRTYVHVVFWSMTFLLLFTTVLLASFSIPNDIKQQTIHTIVTKPVERFEVLLG